MPELAFLIAEKVLEKLESLDFFLPWELESDIRKLEGTVSAIQAVLLDAEEKQASIPPLNLWLGRLKGILYDAEDMLDEMEWEAFFITCGSTGTKVRSFSMPSMPLPFHPKQGDRIRNIRERLDEIAADKDRFNLTVRLADRHFVHWKRDMGHTFVDPTAVIGRKMDQEKLIDLLMHPAGIKVNVIPIVGFGGVGKTTLAKLVYNDERVVKHFELKIWVQVSEDFDNSRLIKKILDYSAREMVLDEDVSTYQLTFEKLMDKRFILILDDVRNLDYYKWIHLINMFYGESEGSKVIVTTHGSSIAPTMDTVSQYSLEGLSQEDCLSLFVKCAFKKGEDRQHPNLLEIGKEIVEKCVGVPLAVKTLGGLLYSRVDEREWKFVRDNEIWKVEQKEGNILPALRLSYDQMPSHLKQCFAYFSLFPKDHEFDSHDLVLFWMAHGILQKPNNENRELEDVGYSYIKEFLSRSFFQDVSEYDLMSLYKFKVHDLVHDLALLVAAGEYSIVDFGTKNIAGTARHLSFSDNSQDFSVFLNNLNNRVRTIVHPIKKGISYPIKPVPIVEEFILRFKYLRALDFSNSYFEVLPTSIGTLKHLRYLSLSGNEIISKLPDTVCQLHNLQALRLLGCSKLEGLPKDITNMVNLRYLTVTTIDTCLFQNGVCFSLRVLIILDCPRLKFLFPEADGCLSNLQKLTIINCPNLRSLSLNIRLLTALEALAINDCEELCLTGGEDNRDLKMSLQKLEIFHLPKLEVLPQWLQGSANTLQMLVIIDCRNFKALPEWLPSLNSLQTLHIVGCHKLSSLAIGMDRLAAVGEFCVQDCPELIRKCKQEDWLKIAHIPRVRLG